MCFDLQEFVLFSNDLKKFFMTTFFTKKAQFEMEFADFLWNSFPNLDDQFVETVYKNVNRFSTDQKLDCCVNFVIKLIVLSENSRCVACSREADKLAVLERSAQLRKNADRQLHALETGLLDNSRPNSPVPFDNLVRNPNLNTELNKVLQIDETGHRSIISRCSSLHCQPCLVFMNYLSFMIHNRPLTMLLMMENLSFQDLRFRGVIVERLKHNRICKDFYDLLDRLHWSFSPVEVKLRRPNNKIITRRMLVTRLPISLPDAIPANKIRSSENRTKKDTGVPPTVRLIKFYYDPIHFISHNLFGRNLLDKLAITVNKRTSSFSFPNCTKEYMLKERKNVNFEEFDNLNFVE